MLDAARQTAAYYLANVPDGVPNWDFDAPFVQKDSSAAAAAASGFLELSRIVGDVKEAAIYRDAATRALDALASPEYFGEGTQTPGVLLHGVGSLPHGSEVDVTLIYGDYYFLEAVQRFMALL
jgi:unsaturated chondroitin disaccharide hydrolase